MSNKVSKRRLELIAGLATILDYVSNGDRELAHQALEAAKPGDMANEANQAFPSEAETDEHQYTRAAFSALAGMVGMSLGLDRVVMVGARDHGRAVRFLGLGGKLVEGDWYGGEMLQMVELAEECRAKLQELLISGERVDNGEPN